MDSIGLERKIDMTDIVRRPESQARVEIGTNGTDVYDADGALVMHLDAPDDFQLAEPVYCNLADEAYIRGYVEGFNHSQLKLPAKYREGDTVR